MKVRVWSEGDDPAGFVEFEVTEEQHARAVAFIEANRDGEFFCSDEFHEIFTEEQNEEVNTGTQSLVAAFCPDGVGCEQHGWDDFAIVTIE